MTSIELEHTDKLGSSLGEIAAEKAGILKPSVPVVLGPLPAEARSVVLARALEVGSPVVELGAAFRVELREESLDGLRLRLEDEALDVEVRVPVLGAHQAVNAALAVACVRALGTEDSLSSAVVRGLAAVFSISISPSGLRTT